MQNFEKHFRRFIQSHYPTDARKLISNVEREFSIIEPGVAFAKTSKNPIDRRLSFAAYFLAFIAVLDKQGETYDKIREISLQLINEYVQPANAIQKFMRKLPVVVLKSRLGTVLVNVLERKMSKAGHHDGFLVKVVTDKNETYGLRYGIDILECGICKLFNKHGYSKYAKILCEVDEITSGLAGLQLIRSGTIANGAMKCDFRWKLK